MGPPHLRSGYCGISSQLIGYHFRVSDFVKVDAGVKANSKATATLHCSTFSCHHFTSTD